MMSISRFCWSWSVVLRPCQKWCWFHEKITKSDIFSLQRECGKLWKTSLPIKRKWCWIQDGVRISCPNLKSLKPWIPNITRLLEKYFWWFESSLETSYRRRKRQSFENGQSWSENLCWEETIHHLLLGKKWRRKGGHHTIDFGLPLPDACKRQPSLMEKSWPICQTRSNPWNSSLRRGSEDLIDGPQ